MSTVNLNAWLGYATGEVVGSKLRIGQIFTQYAGHDPGILFLQDFDGEVFIQRKDRSVIPTNVHQILLRRRKPRRSV